VRAMSTPTLSLKRYGRVDGPGRAAVVGLGRVGDLLEAIRAAPWVVTRARTLVDCRW
jgi:hypothetical protein